MYCSYLNAAHFGFFLYIIRIHNITIIQNYEESFIPKKNCLGRGRDEHTHIYFKPEPNK